MSGFDARKCQAFVDETNTEYARVHSLFEAQFWGTKMALTGVPKGGDGVPEKKAKTAHYSTELLTKTKAEMEGFLSDPARLATTKRYIDELTAAVSAGSIAAEAAASFSKVLAIFKRTFLCYIMESTEARQLREAGTVVENELNERRNKMALGATLNGEFVSLSSVGLRNRMKNDKDEAVRKACYAGLLDIGPFICENGFIDVVKKRNEMAKKLGYQDFYEYKVTTTEGFGKQRLFEMLDSLEQGTRGLMESARAQMAADNGDTSLEAWNLGFAMAGDVTAKLDPYFPFTSAVEAWGRSYNAMGIKYRGATMDLDLLDRKDKYSNGFCHWPVCAWVKPDGSFQPSCTNFTSLADPKAVGSGLTALTTLMHEAGHAAHFANIAQPSPLFAQERAPTSVAYAETQSMFLDSLVNDAAWRAKYAKKENGERIPWDLVEEDIKASHPYAVFSLRSMLSVPYFEKALYEMPADELTPESIIKLAADIEQRIQGGAGPRPLLSVPHIISDEASCYYHGYVLAEMAVWQTREWFMKEHGFIVDNPVVGPTLTKAYWECGNSENFLDLIKGLTGRDLDGASWTNHLTEDITAVLVAERKDYDKAIAEVSDTSSAIDLDMTVRFVDGDTVIADTSQCGGLLAACTEFADYIKERR